MTVALAHGIFSPYDVQVMRQVFTKISLEPWFSPGAGNRASLASCIMRMYRRGLVCPERLEALCRLVAHKKFSRQSALGGYRLLLAEDDYHIAADARQRLNSLGAEVLSVSSVSAALDIAEHEYGLDGALLDVNLSGEMVYSVAAVLKMRHIPFAFVTGYDDRLLPPSYRNDKIFMKPTDWAIAAKHVVGRPRLPAM
jgi:CheY-like chemotaxis protein